MQFGCHRLRDGTQDMIAGAVPVGVVDALEVVDVYREERDGLAVPLHPHHRVRQCLVERPAVRQSRQAIDMGELFQRLLQLADALDHAIEFLGDPLEFGWHRHADTMLPVAPGKEPGSFDQAVDTCRHDPADQDDAADHRERCDNARYRGEPYGAAVIRNGNVMVDPDRRRRPLVGRGERFRSGNNLAVEPLRRFNDPAISRDDRHRQDIGGLRIRFDPSTTRGRNEGLRFRIAIESGHELRKPRLDPGTEIPIGLRVNRIAVLGIFIHRDQAFPDQQANVLRGHLLLALAERHVVEGRDNAALEKQVACDGRQRERRDRDDHPDRDPEPERSASQDFFQYDVHRSQSAKPETPL